MCLEVQVNGEFRPEENGHAEPASKERPEPLKLGAYVPLVLPLVLPLVVRVYAAAAAEAAAAIGSSSH